MNVIQGDPKDSRLPFPMAIVVSEFNRPIMDELLQGTVNKLQSYGFTEDHMTVVQVPGAVEIPLIAKRLATTRRYGAIIALGAVIRGETTHYDYVCEQVSQGCQKIGLEFDVPVIFGVLTTENEEQAWARLGGSHGHKGEDAAEAALTMYSILGQLEALSK